MPLSVSLKNEARELVEPAVQGPVKALPRLSRANAAEGSSELSQANAPKLPVEVLKVRATCEPGVIVPGNWKTSKMVVKVGIAGIDGELQNWNAIDSFERRGRKVGAIAGLRWGNAIRKSNTGSIIGSTEIFTRARTS